MKMKSKVFAIIIASLALVTNANAQGVQQTKLACTEISSAQPASGGYKRIGIRAPKATKDGARVTTMAVQVFLAPALARTDAGLEQPKIAKVFDCKDHIGILAKAEQLPEHDATEVVVPETIEKGTKIQVCASSTGCLVGKFEDFGKWIDVSSSGAATPSATKISGKYN